MISQRIADCQSLSGGHLPSLLGPTTPLERGDRAPIAASEGDDVLFAHGSEDSKENAEFLAGPTGLEPATSGVTGRRSRLQNRGASRRFASLPYGVVVVTTSDHVELP